jgi:hypothetical protein
MKYLQSFHQGGNPSVDAAKPLAVGDLNHLALRPDRAEHRNAYAVEVGNVCAARDANGGQMRFDFG